MPILLQETRNPNDQALVDYPSSFGAYIGAKASNAFASNYVTGLLPTQGAVSAAQTDLPTNMEEMQNAIDPVTGVPIYDVQPTYGTPKPKISADEAKKRVKDAGVTLTVPETGIVPEALDLMIKNQQDRLNRQMVIERSPTGLRSVAGFGTEFAVSMLDPVNIASAFVPIVGEARYTAMLASAGGFLGRTGVRAGVGAAEGLVGSVLVEPLLYGLNKELQNDYTMVDSLANIAFGTAFGGGLHVIAGGTGEAYRGLRGMPNSFDNLRGLTVREAMDVQRFRADFMAGNVKDVEAATGNFNDRMRKAAGLPERDLVDPNTQDTTSRVVTTEPAGTQPPFARMYEITPEGAQVRALADVKEQIRAELLAATGNRAEPGAVPALRAEIARLDATMTRLGTAEEFKARAKENQGKGMSRKEAESAARKSIEAERADAQASTERLQQQLDANAKASQAEQALAELDKGNVPDGYAARVQARANEIMGAAQIAGAVNQMASPPASMIVAMATPDQQAGALRVAVAHLAEGKTPNVEPILITTGAEQLQAAAERQNGVGATSVVDPEGAAAATRRYEASKVKDAKLEVAQAEAEKATAQLDAAIKNLEASGASPALIAKLRAEAAAGQDVILYSRGEGGGGTVEGVTSEVGQAFSGKGKDLVDSGVVSVVKGVDELPARTDGKPHPADAKGYFDGRRAYLVADNLAPGEASGVLLHEVGAHYGMEQMLGPKLYQQLLSEIEAKANAGVAEFKDALDRIPADTPPERVKDELLAYLVQNQPELPLVQRILSEVKQFIYRVLGGRLIDLNADDIRMMAVAALKRVSSAQEAATPGTMLYARGSSVDYRTGKEKLTKFGLEPGKSYNTRDIAAAMEARQREKIGVIARDDFSDETAKKIGKWMTEEVQFAVDQQALGSDAGVGWYSDKYQRALDNFGEVFPELKTDKVKRDFFTSLVAIMSDGQKVFNNFTYAARMYEQYKATGKLPTDITFGGERSTSMNTNMRAINDLVSKFGESGMGDFLRQEFTVSQLSKMAKESGITFSSAYKADTKLPMAALVFGPKLGAFYANLMGSHGYLTMDRWWSRTFNRYRGQLLTSVTGKADAPTNTKGEKLGLARFKELIKEPDISDAEALTRLEDFKNAYEAKGYKDGTEIEKAANTLYKAAFVNLEDSPFNASDREFMIKSVNEAQRMLKKKGVDLSIADIQAVLWYYEKRLYGELGARQSADVSYEEAAKRVVSEHRSGPDGWAAHDNAEPVIPGPDGSLVEIGAASESAARNDRAASIKQSQAAVIEDIKTSGKTFNEGVKDAQAMGEAVNAAAICGLRS